MPILLPQMIDREDIEKFIKVLNNTKEKVDRQDYSPEVASMMLNEGYINDEDIVSKMKELASTIP